MEKIDTYINKIYKDFNSNQETSDLKEEMKSHLYDKVNELIKNGKTKEDSINDAIKSFGEEQKVSFELSNIIKKQNKIIVFLLISSIFLFISSVIIYVISQYSLHLELKNFSSNNPNYIYGIIENKFVQSFENKNTLTDIEKQNFIKILDEYNSRNPGLTSFIINYKNKTIFDYKKELIDTINFGGSKGSYGFKDFVFKYELQGKAFYIEERNWDLRHSINIASNLLHNKLQIISFQLAFLSWMLILIYFVMKHKIKKSAIVLLTIETFLVFTTMTFYDHKDFILFVVPSFAIISFIIFRFNKTSSIKFQENL